MKTIRCPKFKVLWYVNNLEEISVKPSFYSTLPSGGTRTLTALILDLNSDNTCPDIKVSVSWESVSLS